MTTQLCAICGAPLPPKRRKYCSDGCYNAYNTIQSRIKYQSDPVRAQRKNAATRAWSKAHPEQRNKSRRAYRARLKAQALARVLERVRS